MHRVVGIATLLCRLALALSIAASARTFGGFDCTIDCSGHAAGYRWAEEHDIDDEDNCPLGNSESFHEGCVVYVREPSRGADRDDDDDLID
jgi:hypothetical protein